MYVLPAEQLVPVLILHSEFLPTKTLQRSISRRLHINVVRSSYEAGRGFIGPVQSDWPAAVFQTQLSGLLAEYGSPAMLQLPM